MAVKSEIKGDTLVLTIDLKVEPYKSKSAIAKAAKAGITEDKVPATMLADTGGFTRCGDTKFSLNVMKA